MRDESIAELYLWAHFEGGNGETAAPSTDFDFDFRRLGFCGLTIFPVAMKCLWARAAILVAVSFTYNVTPTLRIQPPRFQVWQMEGQYGPFVTPSWHPLSMQELLAKNSDFQPAHLTSPCPPFPKRQKEITEERVSTTSPPPTPSPQPPSSP